MSGYNGTGPVGCGPMTGRRAGYCSGFDRDVERKRNLRSRKRYLMDDREICYGIRRRFRDRDRLFASPEYYRRRYGQHIGYPDRDYSEEPPTEADREYYQKVLREEAYYLQKELKAIEKRIEELKTNEEER